MVTTNIIHISDAINSRLDPHQFKQQRMIMLKQVISKKKLKQKEEQLREQKQLKAN